MIHKDRVLSTGGPYAYSRNPLYVGSFLIGLGVTVAGGRPLFLALFLVFFGVVYARTARREARELEARFGEAYRRYAARVPLFLPRPTPYRGPGTGAGATFSVERWRRNREWEAALGVLAGFAFLLIRMLWS